MGSEQQAAVKAQPATVSETAKSAPKAEQPEYSMLATDGPPHDFGRVALYGGTTAEGMIRRKCDCGGECPECKAKHAAHDIPAIVHENMHSIGQPLDAATRAYFEPRFGHDFSRVKVHNDARAHAAARAVHAAAYTVGADITFAAGQFQPATPAGKRLLAHELTHVVQQQHAAATPQAALKLGAPAGAAEQEAEHIAAAIEQGAKLPGITAQPVASLARAKFDVETISKDANEHAQTVVPIGKSSIFVALLFLKYGLQRTSGDLTMAADYPKGFVVPTDKTKRVSSKPEADQTNVTLSNIPVAAHFFPTFFPARGKALVIGGFHGDERPGFQATDALVDELTKNGGAGLAFNTIIIPRLNAAAIKDELDGVKLWRNRCNRQLVDLNRDFPTGVTPKDTDCKNTGKAPRQPETAALINLIEKFKPDRIVSVHAISTPSSAGIFADPAKSKEAVELARGMASTLVHASDRPANKLGTDPKSFDAVYPLDRGKAKPSAGTSLGAWAPTAAAPPGKTTPVITIEAPGFKDLGTGAGDEARTVEGFVRPLRAFLADPDKLATAADRDILKDIDAFNAADRVAFLTGIKPVKKNDILKRIKFRVDTAIASLNAMKPPVTIKAESDIRLFEDRTSGGSSQADIYFEKFFLTGGRANGWDTLPDEFFNKGNRKKGVDRKKWLETPSKERLDIILKYSALPGTSRHHWGTEVDINSTNVEAWKEKDPPRKDSLFELNKWMQVNAPNVGLIQSYSPDRKDKSGGYNDEPWHYSYAPIALGLRERYNKEVNLQQDVIDKIVASFEQRAKKAKQTLPADFAEALKKINISNLVNKVAPGL
jgi:predicted deacylase